MSSPYQRRHPVPPTQRAKSTNKVTLPGRFDVKLVGCSFAEGYPATFHRLHELWMVGDAPDLDLAREPDNPHDPNSVAVVVAPTLRPAGVGHQGGLVVGHVPRTLAARLAESLDAGDEWVVTFWEVLLAKGSEQQPGMHVTLQRKHVADR